MRTGSCAVQQGLTQEAASIVKQAVTVAKRRGHAQVTPLHVASTMLSITNGLLRNACLQSHSHPLQCKALELCFNVALNRLPTMLGSHHHNQCPSISNALIAAFKRAQAHQRRGSIENQQQPLLTVKIEIEQLIISILDDPSVSRVMTEAGFSSVQVKSNVEQAVSLEICSKSSNNDSTNNIPNPSLSEANKSKKDHNNNNKAILVLDPIIRDEDISSVIENLVVMSGERRIKSSVIVGECVGTLEGVVKGVMDKVEKGDEVSEVLRGVKFFTLSLSSFVNLSRLEVEQKVEEIRKNMSSNGKGCVLYLGDLKWVFDYKASYSSNSQQGRGICYCPVDHVIMEIAKLVSGGDNNNNNNNGRFWIMGVATFRAYMMYKNGEPSFESLWDIHPITIPSGSLSLSLITHSGLQNQSTNTKSYDDRTSWLLEGVGIDNNNNNNNNNNDNDNEKKQQSKADETSNVRSLQRNVSCNSDSLRSSLPVWLQHYKNENIGVTSTSNDQDCVPVRELGNKWNSSMCSSMQKLQPCPSSSSSEKTITLSPPSYSSTPTFSYEHQNPITKKTYPFLISSSSNPSSNPNSTSSSDIIMEMEYITKFKELNSENLKTLCNALERKVPILQKDIIHEIVSTLLQCRSGMMRRRRRRKGNNDNDYYYNDVKGDTWLFFQGVDVEGAKEKIARELAKLVFGSQNNFISISLTNFASSTRANSSEGRNYCCRNNKRSREEQSCSYIERFIEAVSCNPHRVFFVEDIEQADYGSLLGFKRAIERGKVEDSSNGEEFGLCDAIIILSCESFRSRSRVCSPNKINLTKEKSCEGSREEEKNNSIDETRNPNNCVSLDLNISIDYDDGCGVDDEDRSVDEIGLVESVDRKVIFKTQEL